MNTDKDSNTENFFDCLTSNLFVPHIIYPTRITHHSKTLIDNIFSNSTNNELGKSGNLTLSISDHLAQFLILPKSHIKNKVQNKTSHRDMSNFNKGQLINNLSNVDWESVIDLQKNDPNFSYSSFESTVNIIIDNHIPIKTISKRKQKVQSKPWITKGIKKSIIRREKIYKNYLNAKNLERKQQLREDYKNIRNQIVTLCRTSKKLYYQSYFAKNATNSKNIWKGINSIIHLKDTNKKSIDSISTVNGITNEPKEIANNFNEYFSSVALKLQANIYNGFDFKKYLHQENETTFIIQPTNEHEISAEIKKLDTRKSTGPHSIPTSLLKEIDSAIAGPLSKIINLSFQSGKFIEALKYSKVNPIFKLKEDRLLCSNYRPISLLSNINKIIEKLMHKRLYSFLS